MRAAGFIVVAVAGTAAAQPAPGAFPFRSKPAPPAHDSVTFSFSPVHLIYPMVELAVEPKLAPKIGVALVAGGGTYGDRGRTYGGSMWEVGGQLNYYMLQNFEGLHAGVEVLYLRFTGDDGNTIASNSATFGPYVGFKAVASFGATFIAQGGVGISARNGDYADMLHTVGNVFPLLNLNLGWTF